MPDGENNAMSTIDALSDAWDQAEGVETAEEEQQELPLEEGENDESGVEKPSGDELSDEGAAEEEPVRASAEPSAKNTDGVPSGGAEKGQEVTDDEKPPVAWRAQAREQWKDLPKGIKDEVMKRERDFAMGIQKYAEGAKAAQRMFGVLQPYQAVFSQMGARNPIEGVQQVLQTATQIFSGNRNQQARAIANLIKDQAVDLQLLDHVLTEELGLAQQEDGQPSTPQQPAFDPSMVQQEVQRALAPLYQQAQQRSQAQIQSELQAFANDPENEFYRDVRGTMADILDVVASQGRDITLKEAYDMACKMDPNIQQAIQIRQSQKTLQDKRRAASSVRGTPAGAGDPSPPSSIREAINQAWEGAGRV